MWSLHVEAVELGFSFYRVKFRTAAAGLLLLDLSRIQNKQQHSKRLQSDLLREYARLLGSRYGNEAIPAPILYG